MHVSDDIDIHFNVWRELATDPVTSQRSLAKRLGVSLGRINFCVRALTEKGWIKANNFRRSDSQWAYAYVLTPEGMDEKLRLTAHFLQRKSAEYDRLQAELERLRKEMAQMSSTH